MNRIDYIYGYFSDIIKENKLDGITLIKENQYIDKFFLRDYAKYYAESFSNKNNRSERLHFFAGNFDESEFTAALSKGSFHELFKKDPNEWKIDDSYLGHVTIKPVEDEYGSKTSNARTE